MVKFIARRIGGGLVVILVSSIVVFALSRASGDPRLLYVSQYSTAEQWDEWGRKFGLDKPYPVQYLIWASKAVRGDFGESLYFHESALNVIQTRAGITLQLALGAFIFAVVLGMSLGVAAAVFRGSGWDLMVRAIALFGQAMPGFWIGIMLILIFSVQFRLFPTFGYDSWRHFVLPCVTLGWFPAASLMRLVRSSLLENLDAEFVRFARAKGVSRVKVVWKHALRNAMIVPVTYAGLLLAAFITGAVIVESVFGLPGLGRLSVQAVFNTDFPVLSLLVMTFTAVYVCLNLLVDLLYVALDPRMRVT